MKLTTLFFVVAACIAATPARAADSWTLASPDGSLQFVLRLEAPGTLRYAVPLRRGRARVVAARRHARRSGVRDRPEVLRSRISRAGGRDVRRTTREAALDSASRARDGRVFRERGRRTARRDRPRG